MKIPFYQAILGAQVPVPTIYKQSIRLTVPPGTQSHTEFRLPSQGIQKLRQPSGVKGDQIVRIMVEIPSARSLTSALGSLIEQYRDIVEGKRTEQSGNTSSTDSKDSSSGMSNKSSSSSDEGTQQQSDSASTDAKSKGILGRIKDRLCNNDSQAGTQ